MQVTKGIEIWYKALRGWSIPFTRTEKEYKQMDVLSISSGGSVIVPNWWASSSIL